MRHIGFSTGALALGDTQTALRMLENTSAQIVELSALRQIEAAIDHMYAGQFECAVTLALAAEDHMPRSDAVYLQNELEKRVSKKGMSTFYLLRNWLKHHIEPDEFKFSDFEAAIALVRATSKLG